MTPRNPYVFTREEYNDLVKKIPHPHYSTRSDYEEIELVEDCTLYDIYRQPRAPVTDPQVTRTLPVRVLNADLTCPICLGIIRQTEVVMECLHRFCGDCIQRSLRLGKNECPSCRMHIPSKRSLRRDANFDALIAKIYPNLDEFNSQEEKLIAEINKERYSNNAVTASTKKGQENQLLIRRNGGKRKQSSDPETPPSSSSSAAASPASPHGGGGYAAVGTKREASWAATAEAANGASPSDENGRKKPRTSPTMNGNGSATHTALSTASSTAATTAATAAVKDEDDGDKVNVRVLLHPKETGHAPKLERTLFRTSYKLKVRHLKKHLISLLKLDSYESMRIILPAKNCAQSGLTQAVANQNDKGKVVRKDLLFDQELEDHVTLLDIYQQYAMGTKWELQLFYHFSDTIVNGVAQFIASGV